jgi:hypothetical protein
MRFTKHKTDVIILAANTCAAIKCNDCWYDGKCRNMLNLSAHQWGPLVETHYRKIARAIRQQHKLKLLKELTKL